MEKKYDIVTTYYLVDVSQLGDIRFSLQEFDTLPEARIFFGEKRKYASRVILRELCAIHPNEMKVLADRKYERDFWGI